MSDHLTSLVLRAWDAAPRARPPIAPLFSSRPVADIEEREVAIDASPPRTASPAMAPGRSPAREAITPAGNEPSHLAPVAQPVLSRVPAPASARPEVVHPVTAPIVAHPPPAVAPVAPPSPRETPIAAPIALPPPALREADRAALRAHAVAAAPRNAPHASSPGPAGRPALAVPPAATLSGVEPIHVSIGRIDVRATSAPVPTAFNARAREPAPREPALSLEDYLRQRQERR
jgi:hypothetical protein